MMESLKEKMIEIVSQETGNDQIKIQCAKAIFDYTEKNGHIDLKILSEDFRTPVVLRNMLSTNPETIIDLLFMMSSYTEDYKPKKENPEILNTGEIGSQSELFFYKSEIKIRQEICGLERLLPTYSRHGEVYNEMNTWLSGCLDSCNDILDKRNPIDISGLGHCIKESVKSIYSKCRQKHIRSEYLDKMCNDDSVSANEFIELLFK